MNRAAMSARGSKKPSRFDEKKPLSARTVPVVKRLTAEERMVGILTSWADFIRAGGAVDLWRVVDC